MINHIGKRSDRMLNNCTYVFKNQVKNNPSISTTSPLQYQFPTLNPSHANILEFIINNQLQAVTTLLPQQDHYPCFPSAWWPSDVPYSS